MFITVLIFWLIVTNGNSAISVGVIYHASLVTSNPNMTITGLNCGECLCMIFTSSIFSLNCLTNNSNGVVCQLFSNEIYLGLNVSQMKINLNSTFYFRVNTQSEITTAQIMITTNVTTSKDITTSLLTTTTTTPVCSALERGTLTSLNSSIPSSWTKYSYNYTALSTTLTLIFGFQTEPARTYYLDDVSIVDISATNIQLLNNPSFENSTTTLNGWTLWCSTSCSGSGGKLYSNNKCRSSTGICFGNNCAGSSAINFLGQTIPVMINHVYIISYWLLADGGVLSDNHFYVDIN